MLHIGAKKVTLSRQDLLYPFRDEKTALADAKKAEQDLADHRCSYAYVAQMYRDAMSLGSIEAKNWIDKERKYLPMEIPPGEAKWGENLHGDGTISTRAVSGESFPDGYADDQ
jgi:hypothetical protein